MEAETWPVMTYPLRRDRQHRRDRAAAGPSLWTCPVRAYSFPAISELVFGGSAQMRTAPSDSAEFSRAAAAGIFGIGVFEMDVPPGKRADPFRPRTATVAGPLRVIPADGMAPTGQLPHRWGRVCQADAKVVLRVWVWRRAEQVGYIAAPCDGAARRPRRSPGWAPAFAPMFSLGPGMPNVPRDPLYSLTDEPLVKRDDPGA